MKTLILVLISVVIVILTQDPRWLIFPIFYILFQYLFLVKENLIEIPETLEPTLNDPFMNNIDSDVLKILPKDSKKLNAIQENFLHWNKFKDADDIFDRSEDRTFYTTPPEDQEAFISFLNYDLKTDLDVQYNDLKKDHYLFPIAK